jgi:GT2 family glycosyltransferase
VVNGGGIVADQVVQSFIGRSRVAVDLVKTVNRNLAASRNVGLPLCSGDIIAMTDDDAEVSPDWVSRMKALHAEHPEAGAVGGAVIGAESDHSLLSRVADVATFPSPTEPGYVRTLPGVNVSYKREVVERVGPQDETLFRGEDVDYNWRVRKLGYVIYYDPAVRVLHHHRPTLGGGLMQYYMYGRAYYLVRRKWSDMHSVLPLSLGNWRDVRRLGFFCVGWPYDIALQLARLEAWPDRLAAAPVLSLYQAAWRSGILVQAWREYAGR